MRRTAAVLTLITSLLMAVSAIAGPCEDGFKAYEQGDYKTAYLLAKPPAEQGWPGAQYIIAYMYYAGQGVPQDYAEAVKWFRKAADQGYADAQVGLGLMYDEGKGVPKDYSEAIIWYRKAAEQGDADAQYNLGLMYSKGTGVPQDDVLSHMWLSLAVSRYPLTETEKRSMAEKNRDTITSTLTPAQIAEAQRLAREWKPKKEK